MTMKRTPPSARETVKREDQRLTSLLVSKEFRVYVHAGGRPRSVGELKFKRGSHRYW